MEWRKGKILLFLVFAVISLFGCTLGYKLKAKKWGENIVKAGDLIRQVAEAAQANPMQATSPAFRDQNLPKLDEARSILSRVQAEVKGSGAPGSLQSARQDLVEGVDLLLQAVDALYDAINMGNIAKAREFQDLQQKAQEKLSSAKAKFTGGG